MAKSPINNLRVFSGYFGSKLHSAHPAGGNPYTNYLAEIGGLYVDQAYGSDTEGDGSAQNAYKSIPYALSQPGMVKVIVRGTYVGNIDTELLALYPGTLGNEKELVGEYPNTKILGCIGVQTQNIEHSIDAGTAHYKVRNLLFMQDAANGESNSIILTNFIKFHLCGWYGSKSGTSPKNMVSGSNKLFQSCFFYGPGARYMAQSFLANNVLYSRCVIRCDEGWVDGDYSLPNAGLQIYSCWDTAVRDCLGIDSVSANSGSSHLSAINVTANVNIGNNQWLNNTQAGQSSDGLIISTNIVTDTLPHVGMIFEGNSEDITVLAEDNIVLRAKSGIHFDSHDRSGHTVTVDGGIIAYSTKIGQYGGNAVGANTGGGTITVQNVETYGNTYLFASPVVDGGGNVALGSEPVIDFSTTKLSTQDDMYMSEVGWDTPQTVNLFEGNMYPHEEVIVDALRMYKNDDPTKSGDRGACAKDTTFLDYISR